MPGERVPSARSEAVCRARLIFTDMACEHCSCLSCATRNSRIHPPSTAEFGASRGRSGVIQGQSSIRLWPLHHRLHRCKSRLLHWCYPVILPARGPARRLLLIHDTLGTLRVSHAALSRSKKSSSDKTRSVSPKDDDVAFVAVGVADFVNPRLGGDAADAQTRMKREREIGSPLLSRSAPSRAGLGLSLVRAEPSGRPTSGHASLSATVSRSISSMAAPRRTAAHLTGSVLFSRSLIVTRARC